MRRFLGLTNYFGEYVAQYSDIAAPLYALTSKHAPPLKDSWSQECQGAFQQLKDALVSAPVLVLPDPQAPWVLQTDASKHAVGGVLMQEFQGKLHPVAYSSHLLTPTQQRYPIHDKECFAIVYHLQKWKCHLLGAPFILVQSDHKSLDRLMHYNDLDCLGRQARWLNLLANFNYKVQYLPGDGNVVADCLSRPQLHVLDVVDVQADFAGQLRLALQQDSDTRAMLALAQGQSADTPQWRPVGDLVVEDGLLYVQGAGGVSRLVIPALDSIKQVLLHEAHDAVASGHMGRDKTLHKLQQLFVWKGMAADVAQYVLSCPVCQACKAQSSKPAGLYMPLEVPPSRWHTVCMDFITGLPMSKQGHDSILTVVDKLTKRAHFIPTTCNVTAEGCAKLYVQHVFRLHGMPQVIVSDRDVKFTSAFWRTLHAACGTRLKMSTPFHPQTDGQSEVANRVIAQLLRTCVSSKQIDWEDKLPLLEFAYNDSVSTGTGFTPFFLDLGMNPQVPVMLQAGTRSDAAAAAGRVHTVAYVLTTAQTALRLARQKLKAVQVQQKQQADRHRRAVGFAEGDWVYLSTKHLNVKALGKSRKLRPKWIGPFQVTAMHGPNAAKLLLPAEVRCHPVQNVSKLKSAVSDGGRFPRPAFLSEVLGVEERQESMEVEAVLGRKGKAGQVTYLVKYRGVPAAQARWVPAEDLLNDWDEVQEYERVDRHKDLIDFSDSDEDT
jgi:hypothetical protein